MPIVRDWFAYTGGTQGSRGDDGSKFGKNETTLKQTLREMAVEAWNGSLGQGISPNGKLAEYIQQDSRFAGHDPDRLAAETMDKVRRGASHSIDLDSTRRGGSRRYLAGRRGLNHRSLG
jgi:hypothetical protein